MSITITSGMIFAAGFVLAKCVPHAISTVRDKIKEMKDRKNNNC